MKDFELTDEQITALRLEHRAAKNRIYAYKINTVILLGTGWTLEETAEALLLDSETLRSYVNKYKQGGVKALLETNYLGRSSMLSDEEKSLLNDELSIKTYRTTAEVIDYVKNSYNITYSRSGMANLLNELGFSYKKPKLIPSEIDLVKQEEFIELLERFLENKPEMEPILFYDSSHPSYETNLDYGWFKKGQDIVIPNHGKRGTVNISGAVDLESLDVIVNFPEKVTSESTIATLKKIESQYPNEQKIHLILDNAKVHSSKMVQDFLRTSKINLVFLPPYSPNLNLMERIWGLLYRKLLTNKFYQTFSEFKADIKKFFTRLKHKKTNWLSSLIVPDFQEFDWCTNISA